MNDYNFWIGIFYFLIAFVVTTAIFKYSTRKSKSNLPPEEWKHVASRQVSQRYTDSTDQSILTFDFYESSRGRRKFYYGVQGVQWFLDLKNLDTYKRVVKPWMDKADKYPKYVKNNKWVPNTDGYDDRMNFSDNEPEKEKKKIKGEEGNVVEVDFGNDDDPPPSAA